MLRPYHDLMPACHAGVRWTETAVARASDDFYPRDPASFKPHIGACAYVGFFMSALVQPDWDMFQRCACPVTYITGPCLTSNSMGPRVLR